MKDNYEKSSLNPDTETPEAPAGLDKKILLRIDDEDQRSLRFHMVGFGATIAASVALIIFGFLRLSADLAQSGFFQFASLMFSDFGATVANFPDFILSVVESFPIFSSILFLSGIFAVVWSTARFVREATLIRVHKFSLSK